MKDSPRKKDSAYKQAGVDIDAGNELVRRIKSPVKKTFGPGVVTELGGFGALFDMKKTGFTDPLLVSATDGVGTKLRLAIESGQHNTIGIDLVAMCVNDILATGGQPLFFLDYYACGKLDVDVAESVVKSIATGCSLAGCALIGGETAEMPGMYGKTDYDLAGFAVGAVERHAVLGPANVQSGDTLIGLASSGPHSNGYSLIRKIISSNGLALDDPAPFDNTRGLADALLEPTRIYTKSVSKTIDRHPGAIHGIAHITGGGLNENIARILPPGLSAIIDARSWPLPAVFSWMAKTGQLSADDIALTFNCGIGLVLACNSAEAEAVAQTLRKTGETPFSIGKIETATGTGSSVNITAQETAWPSPR